MKNLEAYVNTHMNQWAKFDDRDNIDVYNLDDATAQKIFNSIDNDLSPENVHCDGEESHSQVIEKTRMFVDAAKELMALGFRSADRWSMFA